MKIHKTVATRAVPFGPDMHQIVCHAYSAPPDPLAGLRGLLLREGRGWEEREVEGRERKGMEGECPPGPKSW